MSIIYKYYNMSKYVMTFYVSKYQYTDIMGDKNNGSLPF